MNSKNYYKLNPEKRKEHNRKYRLTHKRDISKLRSSWEKKQNIKRNLRCQQCDKLLHYRNKSGYCSRCLRIILNKSLKRRNKLVQRKGSKNPNWKGGKSKRFKHISDRNYIQWRVKVFTRDNFTCQGCRQVGRDLEAHHIKEWVKYPELRYKIDNGITLCQRCHKRCHK